MANLAKYKKAAVTFFAAIMAALLATGIVVTINRSEGSTEVKIEATIQKADVQYAEEAVPATVTVGDEAIEGVETGQGAIGEEVNVETVDGYSAEYSGNASLHSTSILNGIVLTLVIGCLFCSSSLISIESSISPSTITTPIPH